MKSELKWWFTYFCAGGAGTALGAALRETAHAPHWSATIALAIGLLTLNLGCAIYLSVSCRKMNRDADAQVDRLQRLAIELGRRRTDQERPRA